MKRAITVLAVLVVVLVAATSVQAQATRTWVSGVGDDANPCSRTAPCKTWAGAISKTAAKGAINSLDPGGFGSLTITKSITVDGLAQMSSSLSSGVNGFVINAASTDIVVIRNVDIHGGLTAGLDGIRILNAKHVLIENVSIKGMGSNGIEIAPGVNPIDVVVRNVTISDTGSHGIFINNALGSGLIDLVVEHSTITGGGNHGILVTGNNNLVVSNGVITANVSAGVQVEQTSAFAFITDTVFEGNGTGIISGISPNTPVTRISRCTIVKNTAGLAGTGTTVGLTSNMIFANGSGNTVSSSVLGQ